MNDRRGRGIHNGQKDKHYALGLTFLFLAVGAFTASHHEMCAMKFRHGCLRGTAPRFLISSRISIRGASGLWHLCLMPLSRISDSPVLMQMLHLLITGVTVYLFVRYAPFNWFQKLLFCFGYFVLYEYAIVARNYALGLLLITVFCVLSGPLQTFCLGGLCSISACAYECSCVDCRHSDRHRTVCEYVFGGRFLRPLNQELKAIRNQRSIWIGFALIGIGILTAVLQLNPPPDTGFAVAWNFNYDAKRVNNIVKLISRAYLPIPRLHSIFGGQTS